MPNHENAVGHPAGAGIARAKLQISGVELAPIEYAGQRVLTLAMIDQVHQRPAGTARRTFNSNRARLIEGEDYFVRNTSEALSIGITAPNGLTLLSETGYSMLVKTFSDDLAWTVQRQLVKTYFAKPALTIDPLVGLSAESRALVAIMCEQATQRAEQVELAKTQAIQQDAIRRIEANQIAAVASVQSFTALGYSISIETPMSKVELTKLGRKASAISQERGLTVDKVKDGRYGFVNSYHVSALDAALEEICK